MKNTGAGKFFVTTPIYYVNSLPHIGHAYTTIAADTLARFYRLMGHDVLFVTGTDEHGMKAEQAAKAEGMAPPNYVNKMAASWKKLWLGMGLSFDDFIRTTEERHKKVSQSVFEKLYKQGDIYKGMYEGWYCASDESFWLEADLVEGCCPNEWCKRPVERVKEENYFFKLSAYQDFLLEHLRQRPDFVMPKVRYNEVFSFVKSGLRDVCVSRRTFKWGIPIPFDPDQVIYVWFEALLNYITVCGHLSDDKKFKQFWPADVHLIAKDILRFHAVIWPAMLKAAGLPLPKMIFAHGWWEMKGEKISKSKGNVVGPAELVDEVAKTCGIDKALGVDVVRYYLFREIPFGADGNFSMDNLLQRYNADLANDLGNLLHRTLPMVEKYFGGVVPEPGAALGAETEVKVEVKEILSRIQSLDFSGYLSTVWQLVSSANKRIEVYAPWKLAKENDPKLATLVYSLIQDIAEVCIVLSPVIPEVSKRIWKELGMDGDPSAFGLNAIKKEVVPTGTKTRRTKPIFPRLDLKKETAPKIQTKGEHKVDLIDIADFKKLNIQIAEVLSAEKVTGADRLLKLKISLGSEERQVIAGIAQWYKPEDLVGKRIVVLANLKDAKIRGELSQGMLLAAQDETGALSILTLDKPVNTGAKVA